MKNLNFRHESWIKKYESNIVPGLGEYGLPAELYGEEKAQGDLSLKKKAMNTVLSDKISLTRYLLDPRHSL